MSRRRPVAASGPAPTGAAPPIGRPLAGLAGTARLTAALLALAAAGAGAHDTWFERRAEGELRLGTGDHYPTQEFTLRAADLAGAGCVGTGAAALPLRVLGSGPTALRLRAAPGAAMCWAQTRRFEVALDDALAEVYLKEIGADAALRHAWQARRARGIGWQERYVKHARIELGAAPSQAAAPMGFDARIEAPAVSPTAPDEALRIVLLLDGRPLPGQPVELRNERAALGLWSRTDAQGRVLWRPPLPGRWLLRAVHLQPAADAPERWDSQFLTLAFEVAGR